MANQQLKRLKQGVDIWNVWRKQHPKVYPDLRGANLRETDLRGADLHESHLDYAIFDEANLSEANLSRAHLGEASLVIANLYRANFSYAKLLRTDLSYCDLSEANLSYAYLDYAIFNHTNVSGANFNKAQIGEGIFTDIDLSTVKGLETVRHTAPSSIGIDTILRSEGQIPETFLRDAGLTDSFIIFVGSLANTPIEYYTCFISYSSKDQDFAEQLHADLQSRGVRCWFALEDLKIGDKFWHRIDESIRLYDKLLVVLSQHSVNSLWVEREVMAALEKEQQQNRIVLFPIKLDDGVMQTFLPWAADIRRSRHIADFTAWKDHDSYQVAFARLLRDLQASAQQKR